MGERGITVGQHALGAFVTGDNNLTVVLVGMDEIPPDLLAALRSGRLRPANIPGAVPLPALTLAIAPGDAAPGQWRITARRAAGDAVERTAPAPGQADAGFSAMVESFAQQAGTPAQTAEATTRLQAVAERLGDALADILSADEAAFLIAAARGDPPPPLLVIESSDDAVLALPWELLRLEGRFAVRDGRLDVARSVPVAAAPVLSPPIAPLSLVVTVAAPQGSGLDYERESYLIVRALHEHLGVTVNEMGELDDLLDRLQGEPPPLALHFSGHGGCGVLLFEDAYGERCPVTVDELLTKIRQRTAQRLPRLFFLACCHGGDAQQGGLPATATALHADGIAQVVGYVGPVLDALSTRAERAFYAELARGRRTRDAVRAARQEMGAALPARARDVLRDAGGPAPEGGPAFAWAQMVLYQRGPDYPLGTAIAAGPSIAIETTERWQEEAYPGSRSQLLKAGFVGRRQEMHALRRDLHAGRHLHVVQGVGGLGKSAFCGEALKLYRRLGWQPLALWCADVEGAAEPVAGLLQQVEDAGRQFSRQFIGEDAWDGVLAALDQQALRQPALAAPPARLLALLQALLQAGLRLVVYLDNLESLQRGPQGGSAEDFADWHEAGAAALWQGLRKLMAASPGRLAVLASGRYRHPDFAGAIVRFRRLPDDAQWRLLRWFPSLRRLSEEGRGGLVERLAGHPRAVEFLEGLVADAIARWEDDNGTFASGRLSAAEEQARIIDAALPGLTGLLSEDLLFDALWDRVLDEASRDLLVRASVLRRPGSRALLLALAGGEAGAAAITRLRTTGLLTEIREAKPGGSWVFSYEVHPLVGQLAVRRSERAATLAAEGHRRAGDHLEEVARTSPSWQDNIEAAWHLRQVGEADRSFDLLAPLVQTLLDRGQVLEARAQLKDIGDPDALQPARGAWVHTFAGDVAVVSGNLAQALTAYRDSLAIRERLAAADPGNAGWQRDLSVSHNRIGDVLVAQGQLDTALTAYRDSLAIAERLAAADPSNAGWQRDLSVSHSKLGDVLVAQGQLDTALTAYRASLAIAERLAAADPGNAGWQRDLSVSHLKLGDVLVAQGQLDGALKAYRASLAIAERLAAADPGNAGWQRDLSVSHNRIGDVLVAQGQLDTALTAYRDSLAIAERLAAADPGNAGWQRDLSVSHNRIGDVLVAQGQLDTALTAYRDSLAIAERLAAADPGNAGWQYDLGISHERMGNVFVAQGKLTDAFQEYEARRSIIARLAAADPGNAGWQRDLSVSHDRIGDVLGTQGQLDGALKAYRDSLAIRERLAAADPGNAGWQRDLSVSHNRIGDVLVAQGQLDTALTAYRDSLAIAERLAAADPSNAGWQRDLSVSHSKLGDVLVAQGQLDAALKAYRDSLAIRERLAAADPGNAGWQRDLSVSHNRIGDVLVAQGQLDTALTAYRDSLAIRERLAAADPGNAGWQRDLSVSHDRIGDVLGTQGQLDGALKAYRDSLAIRERLAAADPGNAGWQRDLSVSHNKLGDVLVAQGQLDAALTAYRDSLAIAERLAAADPGNAGWQRDLFVSCARLGSVLEQAGELAGAAEHYGRGRTITVRLSEQDPSNATWRNDRAWIEARIAALGGDHRRGGA